MRSPCWRGAPACCCCRLLAGRKVRQHSAKLCSVAGYSVVSVSLERSHLQHRLWSQTEGEHCVAAAKRDGLHMSAYALVKEHKRRRITYRIGEVLANISRGCIKERGLYQTSTRRRINVRQDSPYSSINVRPLKLNVAPCVKHTGASIGAGEPFSKTGLRLL